MDIMSTHLTSNMDMKWTIEFECPVSSVPGASGAAPARRDREDKMRAAALNLVALCDSVRRRDLVTYSRGRIVVDCSGPLLGEEPL